MSKTTKMTREEYLAARKIGGLRAAATNKLRYGPDYYKQLGKIGGRAGVGHKFGHGKVDPHLAGHIGGSLSKRRPVEK